MSRRRFNTGARRCRGCRCNIRVVISQRTALRIAAVAFTLLLLLHLDFWRPQRPHLWFGWLPEELAFRIGTILLAWLLMLWICARVWREEQE